LKKQFRIQPGQTTRFSVRGLTDPSSPKAFPRAVLISYGFFFGWAGGCFGWSGVCVGLCSRTIFPSQEMYALVISSRSFFRLDSISAILCSRVLCSSGICSFLSGLAYYRKVDSFLRAECPVALKSLRTTSLLRCKVRQLTRPQCAVLDSREALRHNRHPLRGRLKSWSLPWERIYPHH
jgi:hypothetical protein